MPFFTDIYTQSKLICQYIFFLPNTLASFAECEYSYTEYGFDGQNLTGRLVKHCVTNDIKATNKGNLEQPTGLTVSIKYLFFWVFTEFICLQTVEEGSQWNVRVGDGVWRWCHDIRKGQYKRNRAPILEKSRHHRHTPSPF